MNRLASNLTAAACYAVFAGLTAAAQADDWPQYRHDARHSAASSDSLKLPLAEIWSWKSEAQTDGFAPLYHAVTWHGRAFFVAMEGDDRYLVCANAKTGSTLWKQRLLARRLGFPISDIAGPAVTVGGTVFVYDQIQIPSDVVSVLLNIPGKPEARPSFTVRAFNAADGAPTGFFPMAVMGANGVIPRVSLLDSPLGQAAYPVPPKYQGCPP